MLKNRTTMRPADSLSWDELQQLNNCGRYLSVERYVWLDTNGRIVDCTAHGVTSRLGRTFYVPCPDGNYALDELTERDPAALVILEIVKPPFTNCPIRFQERGEKRWMMAGGNFVGTCDSRYSRLYRYPCSVHDRYEQPQKGPE